MTTSEEDTGDLRTEADDNLFLELPSGGVFPTNGRTAPTREALLTFLFEDQNDLGKKENGILKGEEMNVGLEEVLAPPAYEAATGRIH